MKRPLVAIVGAGPVGSLTALELARNGVGVVLLEARTELSWTSRAICISRRSLEILDRSGVGARFSAKGLSWSKGKTFHRDRLVFELELPHGPDEAHPPFINLQQSYTEQFLVDAIGEASTIDLRWGHRVTHIDQHDGVRLTIETDGCTYELDADWLVAADGARSVVRSRLGLAMRGTSYEGRYLICDIQVEDANWPVERHVWFDAPANPGSTVILHVQPDGVWRIDMQLHEDEEAEAALLDENVLPRLAAQLAMIGVTSSWKLIWKSVYRAHSLSLDSYRHGRVLFAGDAAHLVPIFGVRGLNSGFDDAHNLGWKLACVARGEAPEALLDSYSFERRRATAENIANADKSTWFMSPPTAGFRRMRDAALMLAHDQPWARSLINPRQSSFHIYDQSPVVVPDDASGIGVTPGAPIPNLGLATGRLHSILAPAGFTALLFAGNLSAESVDQAEHLCTEFGIALISIDEGEHAARDQFAAAEYPLYLIRPDEHVAARFRPSGIPGLSEAYRIAIGERAMATPEDFGVRVDTPVESIYECLSLALDRAAAAGDNNMLERIALALANDIGNANRARELIRSASAIGRSVGVEDR